MIKSWEKLGVYSLILIFTISITTAGCANRMNGVGADFNPSNSTSAINSVNMDQLRAEVQTSQTAITNAQAALGQVFNLSTGAFNWDIFFNGVNFQNLGATTQTCLANAFPKNNVLELVLTAPADIATALNCILNDVVQIAGIASGDLQTALTTLQAGLAAAAPGSAEAATIQEMITEVQTLQTQYNGLMMELGSQMTVVTTFLQDLPTLAEGAIPIPFLNLIVGMTIDQFVNPIVQEIIKFQTEIEAL